MSTVANTQIKSIVERIERLDEEAEGISNDKRDIYAEAKSNGFDVPALKTVIQRRRKRRKDPDKYAETESIVETYEAALESGTINAPRARGRVRPSKEDREDTPRAEPETFQSPRLASITEVNDAYRSGNPISNDARFENGTIYFALFPVLGRLKIGISNDVDRRLEEISANVGETGKLLLTLPGTRQEEMRAHEAFNKFKLANEWFKFTPECADLLTSYVSTRAGARSGKIEPSGNSGQLPDWDDLRAVAPDATGDLSSEDFVRELRDGWREPEGLHAAPEKPVDAFVPSPLTLGPIEPIEPTEPRGTRRDDLAIPDDLSIPKAFRRVPQEAAS